VTVREEVIGDCRLILGDCRDVLPTLGRVDAVVTDPPYGFGYSHAGGGRDVSNVKTGSSFVRNGQTQIYGDHEPFDPTHLLSFKCVLFGANHFCGRLPDGGTFHAWDKHCGVACDDSFSDVEFIWTSWRQKSRVFRFLWKGVLKDGREGRERRVHQNQKPIAVMAECLTLVPDADVICDPYMGSASSALACIADGRRFIGVEIDPTHYATALRRVEAAHRQPRLFAEPARRPEQMALLT
jgi:DNA modification methylase